MRSYRTLLTRLAAPFLLLALCGAALGEPPSGEASPAGEPRLQLKSCRLPSLAEEVRCGTYEVFEDRAAGRGRKISLRVAVLPALGEDPAPDPVFLFAGGGQSAVELAAGFALAFAEVRRKRDLVLVDVRGTGESNPLRCPFQDAEMGVEEVLETYLPPDGVRACRTELEKVADLTLYTTPLIVDDIDEVRAALGYERINLWGGSYGTRVALVYLRRHPEAVRSAVIEGAAPTDQRGPLTFARDAQLALDGVIEECAADPECHRAFPDPRADLDQLLGRLQQGPVAVPVTDIESGERKELKFSRNALVQTLRYMLYQPLFALQVPLYLHLAAAGDLAPIGQMAYTVAGGIIISGYEGLYLSVFCSEDVAFIDPSAAAKAHAGTFLGDFRLRQQQAACAPWVRGELPAGYAEPVRSDKPVLIISGERDPVTPPYWGDRVARHLTRSRHLIVPDGGHSLNGLQGAECIEQLVAELFDRGSVEGLDVAGCRDAIRRPPFPLALPADEAIELSEQELGRFVGSYQPPEGALEVVVELVDGRLRVTAGEEIVALTPIAPLRFKIEGAPPGSYVEFQRTGEEITGLELFQGGNPAFRLVRQR